MQHFLPQKKSQTIFYFMSSIFLIAVAAVLAKSDKINYDDYYFNTTKGNIYKFSLIANLHETNYMHCPDSSLVTPFRDIVIQKINEKVCSLETALEFKTNYSLINSFGLFNVTENFVPCGCPPRIAFECDSPDSGDQAYFGQLYRGSSNQDINDNFPLCLAGVLHDAYRESNQIRILSAALGPLLFASCVLLGLCFFYIDNSDVKGDIYKVGRYVKGGLHTLYQKSTFTVSSRVFVEQDTRILEIRSR